MQPLNTNEPPNQRSQTPPNPLPPPKAVGHAVFRPPQETPRKSSQRSTTNVTEHRPEVLKEMRTEMIVCSTWDGFYQYLPDVGVSDMEAEIDSAATDLTDHQLLCEIEEKQLRFQDFLDRPSTMNTGEEKCFKPHVSICGVLANRTLNNRKASSNLVQEPRKYSVAETDGANFKADAYLRLQQTTMPEIETTSKQHIADMAVPCEYKLKTKDAVQNREQLLGTATFCMNDDPRRMHIYGITIEDSTMAVWYFSRSHSAKSPDFDFVEDPRRYIRIMLSLLFANEEELGYDQTVQRHLVPEQEEHHLVPEQEVPEQKKMLCLVYQVKDRYFKTRRAIFDQRGLCITGRATRVWEAIEVQSLQNLQPVDNATPVVLKDVWLDSESKTESENLRSVFDKLKEIAKGLENGGDEPKAFGGMEDDQKELLRQCLMEGSWKKYFLTVVCDWQGRVSKKVPEGAQHFPTLFDLPPSTSIPSSHPHADRSRSTTSHPGNRLQPVEEQPPRHYRPKRQYRVVFSEVCEALHDVRTLDDVAIALRDCVFALQLMFVAGWVHRDISTGNIYAFRGPKSEDTRGILADLEYAKPFKPGDVEGSSDPKTGTAYFMAVEIQKQVPIYNPDWGKTPIRGYEWGPKSVISSELSNTGEAACQDEPETPSFVLHNFQHDLESIFWIVLWTLLARFPPTQRSTEEQRKFEAELYSIFQNASTCPPGRERVFTRRGELKRVLLTWVPEILKPITPDLEQIRVVLNQAYFTRRLDIGNFSTYPRLHHEMRSMLAGWIGWLSNAELPELTSCSSMQDPGPVAASSAVSSPNQVPVKREHSQSTASRSGDDQRFKVPRLPEATDVASSRPRHRKNSAQ
ncbi:hypothetical protein FRC04_008941 [Tulasnella sp. 424]|nr:hypothetical protein FRC04_008941 [Tulasnella sp. 424]KAG8958444.1 hypothetical protein FRC05_008931 [Tulasnella sp. 425]